MPRSFRLRPPGRRALAAPVALLTLLALLVSQSGALARLQASLGDASPARGHAEVIAQGVAAIPDDPIAWRVVADTAEPLTTAKAVERALGFVVTTTDGVNLADQTAGTQQRLAAGEAAFVPEGAIQIRASLTDAATPYLRVGLVGADDAKDAGDDKLVFDGKGFAAPGGQRDIDLLRDVLKNHESVVVPGSTQPTLVIATAGSVTVTPKGGSPVTLKAGKAAEFTGEITIAGAGTTSSFVAGVIGPEVPAPPRETGSVSLGVYLCPAGVTPDQLGDPVVTDVADGCAPVTDGLAISLTDADGNELTLADADNESGGIYAWTGLAFGDYVVGAPTATPDGAGDPTFVGMDGGVASSGAVTIDDTATDARLNLYLFQGATGSITVTVYDCPAGVSAEAATPDTCAVSGNVPTLTVTDADGATVSRGGDSDSAWAGLPVTGGDGGSAYTLIEVLPDGYASVAADGATAADQIGAFSVGLTADAPDAPVSLYNLIEATGTITVDTIVCPDGADNPDTCTRDFGPSALTGVSILSSDGGVEYTEANASIEGDGPYVWPNVGLGEYGINTGSLVPPDGYTILAVVLTPNGADASAGFTLTANLPIANIVVLLQPAGGGEATPPAGPDSDSDGLIDADEVTDGTDPNNPDSDGDCHADGAEVAAGTDPLDPASFPDGDCDTVPDSE